MIRLTRVTEQGTALLVLQSAFRVRGVAFDSPFGCSSLFDLLVSKLIELHLKVPCGFLVDFESIFVASE